MTITVSANQKIILQLCLPGWVEVGIRRNSGARAVRLPGNMAPDTGGA